ncbi:MAG: PQQ-binding-like beta-propeller repeat protein [Acidobacteria bacterium]|nr:PQQ-binding-like beta-propeller repeat protein [Acidobacteriota bacterium]
MDTLLRGRRRHAQVACGAALVATCFAPPASAQQGTTGEWRVHGGDSGFTRYAPLDQINAETVNRLEVVWRRPAVDGSLHARWPDLRYSNQLRSTPLMVDGVLYASNGLGIVEAFDPATGETRWVQDLPFLSEDETPRGAANRGVGYWEDAGGGGRRILSVRPPYLLAIDVETGRLVTDFGDGGKVDLRVYADTTELIEYSYTSPPLVVRDVVVVGQAMEDHPPTKEQRPGYVRAYNVRTGDLQWTWNPIPQAGEPGVETWLDDSWQYSGMANVWTMMSADEELGLVYLPTGAPSNDMYGGHRPGNNLYANSLVCVRADTGEMVWHFQTVHHDLWDYDNNVAPILMDLMVDGREIKAVVQLTKQAMAYTFDRVTGEPVWPIVERPVPTSETPGEWISPTQPFPTKPAPFDVHGMSTDRLIDFTPELRAEGIGLAEPYMLGEIFTPPSIRGDGDGDLKGTLQLPGSVGGAEWGGAGFDPETGMLYIPSVTGTFVADLTAGNPDRMNVRYTRGNRAFPAGPRGLPLLRPPYGRITAIDMNTGEHVWMVPNGDGPRNHPDIAHLNLPPLGQPGRAMTLLTKSLLFVSEGDPIMVRTPPGAGPEAGKGFRAFDKETGDVVWETSFRAGNVGAPITYMHDGTQYIVLPIGSLEFPGEWIALALR